MASNTIRAAFFGWRGNPMPTQTRVRATRVKAAPATTQTKKGTA